MPTTPLVRIPASCYYIMTTALLLHSLRATPIPSKSCHCRAVSTICNEAVPDVANFAPGNFENSPVTRCVEVPCESFECCTEDERSHECLLEEHAMKSYVTIPTEGPLEESFGCKEVMSRELMIVQVIANEILDV